MTDSYVVVGPNGASAFVGPDATHLFAAVALRAAIRLHMKCGMIPTRGVTITRMFEAASKYSNKRYKRGQHEAAIADLTVWIDAMKLAMPIETSNV